MALTKNTPPCSKGPSCSYAFCIRVLFEYPLRGETEGAHEEDEDVRGAIGQSLRPFLLLPRMIGSRVPKGFVLDRLFLWQNLVCRNGYGKALSHERI